AIVQSSESVVVGEMGDLDLRGMTLGDILDHPDQIFGHSVEVGEKQLPGVEETFSAVAPRTERMLFDDQRFTVLDDLTILTDDRGGDVSGINVMRCLSDEPVPVQA